MGREEQIFQTDIKGLKIPTGRKQTSWLFTQRSQEVELGAIENKSREWQGGGLEPGTTRLQVQRPNHSTTRLPNCNCNCINNLTDDHSYVNLNTWTIGPGQFCWIWNIWQTIKLPLSRWTVIKERRIENKIEAWLTLHAARGILSNGVTAQSTILRRRIQRAGLFLKMKYTMEMSLV